MKDLEERIDVTRRVMISNREELALARRTLRRRQEELAAASIPSRIPRPRGSERDGVEAGLRISVLRRRVREAAQLVNDLERGQERLERNLAQDERRHNELTDRVLPQWLRWVRDANASGECRIVDAELVFCLRDHQP